MRIGLFSDTYLPEINGVATSVHTLRTVLEKNGHEVFVVTTKVGGKRTSEWDEDHHVLRLHGIELKFLYGYVLTTPFHYHAYDEVEALHLDLIHVHTEFGVGIFARICAYNLGIPMVSTYHTTYEEYTHYINPLGLQSVENVAKRTVSRLSKMYGDSSLEVIAPSQKTKDMLLGYNVKSTIHVVPTGLDLDRFNPEHTSKEKIAELRHSYGIQDDDFLLIYLGRIAPEKSIDFVINGMKHVADKGLKIKLLIVGGGPNEDDLKMQAEGLGLSGKVIFAGKKMRDEVPAFYHASDAFVSASLTETQGMTYIEAMASGLAVFARPDDVLNDLVVEGKTGFYFSSEEEMADKLESFMAMSDEVKQSIRQECFATAGRYDLSVFYKQVMEVYDAAFKSFRLYYLIDDIKTKDDGAVVTLVNSNKDKVVLNLSLDTYFNYGLRKGFYLCEDDITALKEEEKVYKGYMACVRRVSIKDRTTKEIYDYLTSKTECNIEQINLIVDKLTSHGYINDYRYAQDAFQGMSARLIGPQKIVRTLKKKGISNEVIENVTYSMDTGTEVANAILLANKLMDTIKDRSVQMKKRLLVQKMRLEGFSAEAIDIAMRSLNFADDEKKELDSLKKAAAKAAKRYEKKHQGTQLRNAVFRYCASLGYKTEDIYVVLDEMDWSETDE